MAIKAYVARVISGSTSIEPDGGGRIEFQFVALDGNNSPVGGVNRLAAVTFVYGDTSNEIHQAMADAVRANMSDESVEVYFLDAPGRY